MASVTARLIALGDGKPLPAFVGAESGALRALCDIFDLGAAEAEMICLAMGQEVDPSLAEALVGATGQTAADGALAHRLLGAAAWDALAPMGPVRRWRLVELRGSGPLLSRGIAIDERILGFLLEQPSLDARLEGLVRPLRAADSPGPRAAALALSISAALRREGPAPVVLVGGEDRTGKREAVAAVARALRTPAFLIDAADIPSDWSQRHALALFLDRELALSRAVAMIEGTAETAAMAARLADAVQGPLVISAPEPEPPERAPRRRLDMPDADPSERSKLWRTALRDRAPIGPGLEQLAERFPLDTAGILATAEAARLADPSTLFDALWQAAREQGRPRLEGLAERIETDASWDDLVLPQDQLGILRDLAGHLRHAWTVNHTWGWLAKGSRGLGAAALFSGSSGTGKTLAAEILAAELKVDLYRIDLSQVVSKYIGETEKNLARIFAAAERGGAILLFDEADALFGKRSEVKDSHDRYANVEVSYLLQRMEAYRGLAILTTNQRSALDRAFLRRLRYAVTFPFPDAAARAEIWSRVFPPETPTEKLDLRRLACLGLSGGSIRSIALNAAFLAAGSGEPVTMRHVLRAARREYGKLEKPFTATESEAFQ
jgi:vesicle-fusing ATPase